MPGIFCHDFRESSVASAMSFFSLPRRPSRVLPVNITSIATEEDGVPKVLQGNDLETESECSHRVYKADTGGLKTNDLDLKGSLYKCLKQNTWNHQ